MESPILQIDGAISMIIELIMIYEMHMMILGQRQIALIIHNKAKIQMDSYPVLSLVRNICSMINNYNYYVEDQVMYHHVKCIFHHLMHRSMM